jgi:phosphoserine aminotransferase
MIPKPALRPKNPRFSSGPCTKHPGWSLNGLKGAPLGRYHRQPEIKARLELAIDRTRELLALPAGYLVAIVPASDTGAVEMALWSLLGARGVDVLAWEAFSRDWVTDITEQLKLTDVRALLAPYGELPDLSDVDFDRDVVFAWNGTTSGVRVPNGDFIPSGRKGLTICDATSAVFAQEIDWEKLDAATFSWQKVLGGEAQHGMLILSPRRGAAGEPQAGLAAAEIVPHDARRQAEARAGRGLDYQHALHAVRSGLSRCARLGRKRGRRGGDHRALERKCVRHRRLGGADGMGGFLARAPGTRSNTSVCLKIVDPDVAALPPEMRNAFPARMAALLDHENAARDIASYRGAPAGLRIWTGATVDEAISRHCCPGSTGPSPRPSRRWLKRLNPRRRIYRRFGAGRGVAAEAVNSEHSACRPPLQLPRRYASH